MTGASARQRLVLAAIRRHQAAKGFAPTIRELCTELEISSTNGVAEHLRLLERKGLVSRVKYRSRTLQITNAGRREIEHG